MIVHELTHRARHAARQDPSAGSRETFRDNPLYCRFEVFIDGSIAAFMKYRMNAGTLILIDGHTLPEFQDQAVEKTLMRHVVLSAHKRRLSLIPQCPMALTFLTQYPQYQALTTHTHS